MSHNATSRDTNLYRPSLCTCDTRSAYNVKPPPTTMPKKASINKPRSGSVAKACTDTIIPERTIKVPNKLNENAAIANNTVHDLNTPRFSVTLNECSNAVATSHGINDAFSTGSQNHQPPQPSSEYAHQLPIVIPRVKKPHAVIVHGRDHLAHVLSSLPVNNAAIAKEKATDSPT